jgi:hypothetical protein
MTRVWLLIKQPKPSCEEWLPDYGREYASILMIMKLS